MDNEKQQVAEGYEQVTLKSGNYGWRYTVEQAAKLLRAIDRNGGLMIGGEQYPNSACCCDSAYSLELMLKSSAPTHPVSANQPDGGKAVGTLHVDTNIRDNSMAVYFTADRDLDLPDGDYRLYSSSAPIAEGPK